MSVSAKIVQIAVKILGRIFMHVNYFCDIGNWFQKKVHVQTWEVWMEFLYALVG